MLPTFPAFKALEWSDRGDVEKATSHFPPYSDFNFVSLWAWNTRGRVKLSVLHDNLILLFQDYLTDEPFLTFIGSNAVPETARALIQYSKAYFNTDALRLVPEATAQMLMNSELSVYPDESAHDYIMSVPYLSRLDTLPRSANKAAYCCQRFLERYPGYTVEDRQVSDCIPERYIEVFCKWAKSKEFDQGELNEYSAFSRFIRNTDTGNCILSLHNDGEMIGFATYEIQPQSHAVCHFAKASNEYVGAYEAIFYTIAKKLHRIGVEYWNFEQDLGLAGLRQSKRKYKPEFYLRKFTVRDK